MEFLGGGQSTRRSPPANILAARVLKHALRLPGSSFRFKGVTPFDGLGSMFVIIPEPHDNRQPNAMVLNQRRRIVET